MIVRYRVLAERIRSELLALDQVVGRAERAADRALEHPHDREFFLAAAALDMHGFYAGIERLLEQIASEIDGGPPTGRRRHRDLLDQMALEVPDVRPVALTFETVIALTNYLEFRHVVRNVYTFNLRAERVIELARGVRAAFELARRDLLTFAVFLDDLASADEQDSI
jgi:hypothetical protein